MRERDRFVASGFAQDMESARGGEERRGAEEGRKEFGSSIKIGRSVFPARIIGWGNLGQGPERE